MSEHPPPIAEKDAARVYEVVETITITGVGYVRARSKAEAVEKAKRSLVEFDWDQGQNVRRGDGLKARLVRGDEAEFNDPGPCVLPPAGGRESGPSR